jgi:recombination protein RecT
MDRNEALALRREDLLAKTLNDLNSMAEGGRLRVPKNYSIENALRSAWLIIQQTEDKNGSCALEVCTQPSVTAAIVYMVTFGLNPLRNQVYFIVEGNKLKAMRSYFGTIHVAKMCGAVGEPFCGIVYEGDEFDYDIDPMGQKTTITKHKQRLENIRPEKMVAAYGIIGLNSGDKICCIMTTQQIKAAWAHTKTKDGGFQLQHPEEAAKRTVLNRLVKMLINTSDDEYLMGEEHDEDVPERDEYMEENENSVVIDPGAEDTPQVGTPQVAEPEEPEGEEDPF